MRYPLSNGDYAEAIISVDSTGSSATIDPSSFESIKTAVTGTIKSSSGRVYVLECLNLNTSSVRYIQLFNSTTATGTPKRFYPVNAGGTTIIDRETFCTSGLLFSTAISFGFSTTPDTYTAASASECVLFLRYL